MWSKFHLILFSKSIKILKVKQNLARKKFLTVLNVEPRCSGRTDNTVLPPDYTLCFIHTFTAHAHMHMHVEAGQRSMLDYLSQLLVILFSDWTRSLIWLVQMASKFQGFVYFCFPPSTGDTTTITILHFCVDMRNLNSGLHFHNKLFSNWNVSRASDKSFLVLVS